MNIEKTILMRQYLKRRIARSTIIILAITFAALSALVYHTEVRELSGNNALSLLVSRNIIEKGSIKLNNYGYLQHQGLAGVEGNLYDISPLGTALLSAPAVFLMDRIGMYESTEGLMTGGQVALMTMFNPVIFILLFVLGRQFIPDLHSYLISLVFYLGSPLTSSLGTSLVSSTYALVLCLIITILLARYDMDECCMPNPYVLGVLLFLSYLTKPVFAVFVLAALLYLLGRDRNLFIKACATVLFMLGGVSVFSHIEYGLFMPPYYIESFMAENGYLSAFAALLVSPSRGLFIFMPYLLLLSAGVVHFRNELVKDRLFLFSVGFALLNIIAVSLSSGWYGSGSFGPGTLVDSMPAWALMTFIVWKNARENMKRKPRRIISRAWLALGLISVLMHSWQGSFNQWTRAWNMYPPVHVNPTRIVFDWRHPQMLSTADSVRDKLLWYYGYKGHDVIIEKDKGTLVDFDLTKARGHIKKGRYHLDKEEFDLAHKEFDRAISLSYMEPEALYLRGIIHLSMGRNGNAIEDFSTSLIYNSASIDAYINRAKAYDNTGQYSLALGDYVKATELADTADDDLMRKLYLKRGIDHFRTGEYNNAISDLIIALERGDNSPEAFHHIAASYYASRRFKQAEKIYGDIVANFPEDEKARLMRLNSLRKDAFEDTGAILNDHKEFVVSYPSSGLVRAVSRHYLGMEARGEDEIIIEAENSGNPELLCEVYYLLAEQRLMHGFTTGARSLLRKGEESCPRDIPDYYLTRSMLNFMGW